MLLLIYRSFIQALESLINKFKINSPLEKEDVLLAKDIMKIESKIQYIGSEDSIKDIQRAFYTNRCNALPVFDDDIDNIRGYILCSDLLGDYPKGLPIRRIFFIEENATLERVIFIFLNKKVHIIAVVDDTGCNVGIIGIEDIISGLRRDVYDVDIPKSILQNGYLKITGDTRIDEFIAIVKSVYKVKKIPEENNKLLDILDKYDKLNVQTLTGVISKYLGKFPSIGDHFDIDQWTFYIIESDTRIIKLVKVLFRDI